MKTIYVDGYCIGNPGPCGFRGIMDGKEIFRYDLGAGTNNIAEFVAVVKAIHYCLQNNIKSVVYSDSATAISWVNKGVTNSTLSHAMLTRGEEILASNPQWRQTVDLKKWDTRANGEIPADFGHKTK